MAPNAMEELLKMLPPKRFKGEMTNTSVRLPGDLVKELDRIAEESNYSRSEVIHHFVAWAVEEYRKLQPEPEKKGGKR